jgi:hypothetical protein
VTLCELSIVYRENARRLRLRIRELQAAEEVQCDPDAAWHLHRRITALIPLLREAQELATLTARYYDRSYHRNGKYTL